MLENNRDRGKIKWTAMMLPEHIERLRDWIDEDNLVKRPELTEWDFQLIQEELELAYKSKCETLIKTWGDGKITLHQGIIEDVNLKSMWIVVEGSFGTERIPVSAIISVQSMD